MNEHYISGKHAAGHRGRQDIIRESYTWKTKITDSVVGVLLVMIGVVGVVAGIRNVFIPAICVGVGGLWLGGHIIRKHMRKEDR